MNKIINERPLEDYFKHNFIDSPLVEITSDLGIIIDLEYLKKGFVNAINKAYVRSEVLDKLLLAKKYLPEGLTFKIWDSYRTFSLQEELYNKYKSDIIKTFHLEKLSILEQNEVISNYVSIPLDDESHPPLHTTGGAIDLTLVNNDTLEELNMGTEFDDFSSSARTCAFEEEGMSKEIRDNRRMLYNAMTKAL